LRESCTLTFKQFLACFVNPLRLKSVRSIVYDIRENWELRSSEWVTERTNGMVVKHGPPARVDCSYLITAWASQSTPDPALDEHHVLGEVIKVLIRHRTLPTEVLQGALRGQDPPVRAKVLQTPNLQSLGEFWQALGGKPKAALHYAVTISVPATEPVAVGPPVTETRI
jgi:hypothetical protein